MPRYTIETTQLFNVTYEVEADSPKGAWHKLLHGAPDEAACQDQSPADIIDNFEEAHIEESAT